jgi:hypothetical protein
LIAVVRISEITATNSKAQPLKLGLDAWMNGSLREINWGRQLIDDLNYIRWRRISSIVTRTTEGGF